MAARRAFTNLLTIEQLFGLALLVGTLDVVWLTAYRSYVPVVVPRDRFASAYIFFWSATQGVLLVFLTRNLGMAPGLIGVIFTLGGLLGAAASGAIGRRSGPRTAIVVGSLLRSVGMVLMPPAKLWHTSSVRSNVYA